MIQTGIVSKVKIQDILSNQLPNFIRDESPLTVDFLKQYYISQEYQGGPTDISDNLEQYINVTNLTPEVIVDSSTTVGITTIGDETIEVTSTKGFPNQYGLLKIDDEIITYTGLTTNTFTGCIRGFSGITSYHADLEKDDLVFNSSTAESHVTSSSVQNLSSLFLKEFYKKFKATFLPGLEETDFQSNLDVGTFIGEARSLYQTKGTDESFRILFNVLYGVTPSILNLEERLIKPSFANYVRRRICVAELLEGNPRKLQGQSLLKGLTGQTLFRSDLDIDVNASISEIEPFERTDSGLSGITTYYKIGLFIGYDDNSDVRSDFIVVPNTKSIENVSVGASVITVDSTVGFGTTGTIISGVNTITYTDKTVNQFLNCTGITSAIEPIQNIRSNITYFGFEDGDLNKKVVLRLTGVISEFEQEENIDVDEGEIISIKHIGDKVQNPESNATYKETFSNSWIYNTSSSYFIIDKQGTSYTLGSVIDQSSLKIGDTVEIVQRDSNNIIPSSNEIRVVDVNKNQNSVTLSDSVISNFVTEEDKEKFKLRKKLNKPNSSGAVIEYGSNLISDIQNVYVDDENAYVTSNSLPSFSNTSSKYFDQIKINTKNISANFADANNAILEDSVDDETTFSTIKFGSAVPFETGDKIFYSFTNGNSLVGLETGAYYLKVFGNNRKIKLYGSPSGLDDGQNIDISRDSNDGIHNFILFSQRSNEIGAQKLVKKFTLSQNLGNGENEVTPVGETGILINGVEIKNYKSDDKIYFGPLTSVDVLNSGEDYDVINLPNITISTGVGTTALVQPVISGKVEDVFVDPQNFDVDRIVSIGITGGNGSGCILEPIIGTRFRKEFFSTEPITNETSSGINTTNETITFLEEHNFVDGDKVIYDSNSRESIKIVGVATNKLVNNSAYYVGLVNTKTIKLYETFEDYSSGISTINLGANSGLGDHIFKIGLKNSLLDIKVIDGGQNYTNRKLIVKPTGISTANNTINFTNHGFNDGDLIEYTGNISGLNQDNNYYIVKTDDNSFSLSNAGVGGTIISNYQREEIVTLNSVGSGSHIFKFPDIKVSVSIANTVGVGTTSLIATPKVRGSIKQLYLYEPGTGYGSTTINNHKRPIITLKNGKNSSLTPIIKNGAISEVTIQSGGGEYFSVPDLEVIDSTGKGVGALLRPVISNQRITDVVIINSGIGYSTSSSINVKPAGKNALFNSSVRSLTINKGNGENGINVTEHLEESENKLKYSFIGYSTSPFNDDGTKVSEIIGWAYDGNPIYGPFAYDNPENSPSNDVGRRRLLSGYTLNTANIVDRPNFVDGFFVEDYIFTNSGDLDEHNGRFEITEDFPNGVYAYHATVDADNNPTFPYFIGDTFRSKKENFNFENNLQTNFDFVGNNLLRNTFPYKVADNFANNDFIVETNEIEDQKIEISSVSSGSVTGFEILSSGSDYKVDELLSFDLSNSDDLIASISKVKGQTVTNLTSEVEKTEDSVLLWSDSKIKVITPTSHIFNTNDVINISGLTTDLSSLNGSYKIGVTSFTSKTISTITSSPVAGFTTEIFVSSIPSSISVGSSIGIGTETLKILNIYDNLNILTVQRGTLAYGTVHNQGTQVNYLPDSFTFNKNISFFDSIVNKKVFFNPDQTVGLGTDDGDESTLSFSFAGSNVTRNVPTKQIYLENHPFKTNEKVIFTIPGGSPVIAISTDKDSPTFNLSTGDSLYIVNKTINTVGIKTGIGNNFNEVYFRNINGADSDLYSFETDFNQVKTTVSRVKTTVTTSSSHDLENNDSIDLLVKPKLSVGIGTSSHVRILRDTETGNLLINPISFSNAGISTLTNTITIVGHGLKTGEKVKYNSNLLPEGLENQNYFVYKVDDDNIKLSKTFKDSKKLIPNIVGLGSTGGTSQSLSLINPQLISVKNNNLRFDLSDSSVSGYKLRFYYDQDYGNEFISSGISTTFDVVSVGNTTTIGFGSSLPEKLFYNLEKSGSISTTDTEVHNYSKIIFVDSDYNGTYNINRIDDTSFSLFLDNRPEKLSYNNVEATTTYKTNSKTAKGGIEAIKIISSGSNYKKIPNFVGVSGTSIGKGAAIIPTSNSIGIVESVRVINEGFEYSSDKTLEPESLIASTVEIKNSNTLGIVSVTNGGSDYINSPDIVIVDSDSGAKIESGFIEPIMLENSILSVDIKELPKGLPINPVTLRTINNTNGITILEVKSNAGSSYTCKLSTPDGLFSSNPFAVNDRVFIEGIEKISGIGSGFNSKDYGFNLLKVTKFDANVGGFAEITIDVSEFGASNTGIAKTIVTTFANAINEADYPKFFVTQNQSLFDVNEPLIINNRTSNLKIIKTSNNKLKVFGTDNLNIGDIVSGKNSGSQATVSKITENKGRLKTDFSISKNIGWNDNIGKLSEDFQVIPDNDYYQNMSYSIQSPIEWRNLVTPVNNLLHSSGTKNFADTGITSTTNISIGSSDIVSVIVDLFDEKRVDELRNIDTVRDDDVTDDNVTRKIVFDNIRLSNYISCDTNDVLVIDNINQEFSNLEGDPDDFLTLLQFDPNQNELFNNILIRTESNSTQVNRIQFSDFLVLSNGDTNILLEKGRLINSGIGLTNSEQNNFADFKLVKDDNTETESFRFSPSSDENFDIDYDLKLFSSNFTSTVIGVGTTSIGTIDLTSVIKTCQVGVTTNIISVPTNKFESLHALVNVINTNTNEMNLVETFVSHNGNDSFIAQSFIDTETNQLSTNQIGIITSTISNNNLNLTFENNLTGSNNIKLKAKVIGIGTTGVANGTYRFKANGQLDGSERTTLYSGLSSTNTGISTIISLNSQLFNSIKSVVEVSIGSSKALHEVLAIHDGTDAYVQQSGSLSITKDFNSEYDPSLGLGTFSASYTSNIFELKFHPDNTTGISTVVSLNHCFYNQLDKVNTPLDLTYGGLRESNEVKEYNALEGTRVEKTEFNLNVNDIPIFAKSFNPSDSSVLNLSTGKFTIPNHFFRENEELTYLPKSTFVGIGSTAMQYKNGSIVDILPSTVFANTVTNNSFFISTTRSGTAVTFVSVGEGNAHKFEMKKSNEKSIISIDDVVQSPLINTNVSHLLENNVGSQVGLNTNIINLSGISTISVGDILKIDNEFLQVVNVGIATTNGSPVGTSGTFNVVEVERGFVGTSNSTHADGTTVQRFTGTYNIVESKLFLSDPPRGNPSRVKDDSNLDFPRSTFNGRVYLRNNYDSNLIYDDISDSFTGIKSTFTLKVGGANTIGVGTTGGSGILFINGIFQSPSTEFNPDKNFKIIESGSGATGVTSVVFSGITSDNGSQFISNDNVNFNELPRGGIPISFGSTVTGLGYAPLVGAKVKATTNASGQITNVVGVAYSGSALGIQTATYNEVTGIMTVKTVNEHKFKNSNELVLLGGLEFACAAPHAGVTTTIFPDGTIGDKFPVVSIAATNVFGVNIGVSTIPHAYVGSGNAYPYFSNLTFGSGYNGLVSIGVTVEDFGYEHRFVSADVNGIDKNTGGDITATDAEYNPTTGVLVITSPNHGMSDNDLVLIKTGSIRFTCARDNFKTVHPYPRSTDPVAGINTVVDVLTPDVFSVDVGVNVGSGAQITATAGVGGTAIFTIAAAGSNYKDPEVFVSEPSYSNLSVTGVSRLGIGATTDTGTGLRVNAIVSASSTTGIGSTMFEISRYEIVNSGYGFKEGDVVEAVGLVTAKGMGSIQTKSTLSIDQVYKDRFAMWQFGEFDYIDSIKSLQNGTRTRFPLNFNNELISVEASNTLSESVDIENIFFVTINGIIQEPTKAYTINGGTSINFSVAPTGDSEVGKNDGDDVSILFYRGTSGVDSLIVDGDDSGLKTGDGVRIESGNQIPAQDNRTITGITTSTVLDTTVYRNQGISDTISRPLTLIKQKNDLTINKVVVSKKRSELEPRIIPIAKIIDDISTTDTVLFTDNADLFNYEDEGTVLINSSIINLSNLNSVNAKATASISSGKVTGITTVTNGSGYASAPTVKISAPPEIGVGIGTTATATATVSNGQINSITITNAGLGYTIAPKVLISSPIQSNTFENLTTSGLTILESTGLITGIGTTTLLNKLGLEFSVKKDSTANFNAINVGDPIYIFDTTIGSGLISISNSGTDTDTVGIGTTFVDNVYTVASFTSNANTGVVTCLIKSNTSTTGLSAVGFATAPVGNYSIAKISGFTRSSSPVSIGVTGLTIDAGLSTFPTLKRTGGNDTFNKTGGLLTPS
jgi:hypothetical protein